MPDFLPRRQSDRKAWLDNCCRRVIASPATYLISQSIADELAILHARYLEAERLAAEPISRTKATIAARDAAESALLRVVRTVCTVVRVNLEIDDALVVLLGVKRRAKARRPLAAPDVVAGVHIISKRDGEITLRIYDTANSERVGKPRDVERAEVYWHLGESCSTVDLGDWKVRTTTRTRMTITFDSATPPGAKVWVVARWTSRTGKRGPLGVPVSTHLSGGLFNPRESIRHVA